MQTTGTAIALILEFSLNALIPGQKDKQLGITDL